MNSVKKTVLKNETALITGGSSGIGYAIAKELAERGYNLILASNQEKTLNEICIDFSTRYGIKSWPVFIDLSEPDSAKKLYNWCKQKKLQVDILVNNAGIFLFGETVETNYEKARQMLILHTCTPTLLCNLFGQEMKQRRRGFILNISSLAAFMPYPGIALYSATKRFLKNFSRSLRSEMYDYNVNVTCILPGAVSTQLYQLDNSKRQKAIDAGIMMKADKLAKLAVNAMFKKKSFVIPGLINLIFLLITTMVPHGIVLLVRRHTRFLPPDKKF